jgi:hypothetical protein
MNSALCDKIYPIHTLTEIKNTYWKTLSYPRIAVASLGGKSLAGLMAYPQLVPKERPIDSTAPPTRIGVTPENEWIVDCNGSVT